MGCLACLPLNKLPSVFQADFCFLICGRGWLSLGCSQVFACLGKASGGDLLKTGSVADRFQVGGDFVVEDLGPGESVAELLRGIAGR